MVPSCNMWFLLYCWIIRICKSIWRAAKVAFISLYQTFTIRWTSWSMALLIWDDPCRSMVFSLFLFISQLHIYAHVHHVDRRGFGLLLICGRLLSQWQSKPSSGTCTSCTCSIHSNYYQFDCLLTHCLVRWHKPFDFSKVLCRLNMCLHA